MTRKKWILFFFSFLLIQALNLGAEKKLFISVKGGFYSPSSSTFNSKTLPPTNQELINMASRFQDLNFSTNCQEMKELDGSLFTGFETEVFIWKQFSIACGTEYWQTSRSAFLEAEGEIQNIPYQFNYRLEWKGSLIPILSTIRYHFPLRKFKIYGGGGIGYYLGTIHIKGKTGEENEWKARGHAFLPHINGGLTYQLNRRISLAIDLRYTIGRIPSFEIKDCSYSNQIGNKLTYIDDNQKSQVFPWELNGIHAGIGIRFGL